MEIKPCHHGEWTASSFPRGPQSSRGEEPLAQASPGLLYPISMVPFPVPGLLCFSSQNSCSSLSPAGPTSACLFLHHPVASSAMSSPSLGILTSSLPFSFLGQSRKQRWPTAQELVSPVCGCHLTARTSPSTLLSRAGKTGNKVTIQRSR